MRKHVKKHVRMKYAPMQCGGMLLLSAVALSVAGCGGKTEAAQADENTRAQDAKSGMMKAFNEDPSLKKGNTAPTAKPSAAPPGAPMGSYH